MKKLLLLFVVMLLLSSCEEGDPALPADLPIEVVKEIEKAEELFTHRYAVARLDSVSSYIVSSKEKYKLKHSYAVGDTLNFNINTKLVSAANANTKKGIIKELID